MSMILSFLLSDDVLPSEMLGKIFAHLDPNDLRKVHRSSNALSKILKKVTPPQQLSLTETAQTAALGLFLYSHDDSNLFGEPHVLDITAMAQTSYRRDALVNWIKTQKVCVDAGGFYVTRLHYIYFDGVDGGKDRVRVKLWDRPFEEHRSYYGNGRNDFMSCLRLKAAFIPLAYTSPWC
jgi:hypothetical protein